MMTEPLEIPDSLEDLPPVAELGGAVGRRATVACKQGQHDLCGHHNEEDRRSALYVPCWCRCHERTHR